MTKDWNADKAAKTFLNYWHDIPRPAIDAALAVNLQTAYAAGIQDAADTAVDHKLRGKDQTAAGFYTAITGIKVEGVLLGATKPRKKRCDCCERGGDYNGYGSDGPLAFICPKGCTCPCHD